MSRTSLVNSLRRTNRFRNSSLRNLNDLVDDCDEVRIERGGDKRSASAAIYGCISGGVRLDHDTDQNIGAAYLAPGEVHLCNEYLRDQTMQVRGAPDGASYIRLDQGILGSAARGMLFYDSGAASLGKARGEPYAMWVCEEMMNTESLGSPLEALTHLLASGISRQFDEQTAVVASDANGEDVLLWKNGRLERVSVDFKNGIKLDQLASAFAAANETCPTYIIFVNREPATSQEVPQKLSALRFHEIVYVARSTPRAIPAGLRKWLVVPDGRYSSFTPTIVVRGTQRGSVLRYNSRRFDDDRAPTRRRSHDEKWRLRRDTCVVSLDLAVLAKMWRAWQNGPNPPTNDFATAVFGVSRACETSARRWARAVTDRRVGLALSGGGASAYRMVPLLEKLEKSGVPIDVVSGVSGGALLGAYYCTGGLPGVHRAVDLGPKLQRLVLQTLISADPLERKIDDDLAGARLDELEVRFVPVTTALRRGVTPETHAVVSGTVARGVRASGSAPLLFSRMRSKGIHYTDGATATAVPARILWDYGADIVFACNCIPGPARRNPFAKNELGELAYRSPAGRAIDLWVTAAFLLQQISREMGEDAHGFFEPLPDEMPLAEMVNFKGAADIVKKSARSKRVEKKVQEFSLRWQEFSR